MCALKEVCHLAFAGSGEHTSEPSGLYEQALVLKMVLVVIGSAVAGAVGGCVGAAGGAGIETF